MSSSIPEAIAQTLIQPLLSALITGSLPQYPPTLLPQLSPILRQRLKLFADGSSAWLPHLSYTDQTGEYLLKTIQTSLALEPHPVSGEVELDVDWEDNEDVEVKYVRLDEETLMVRIKLRQLDVEVRGTWCINDAEGGGDGWRISEVGTIGDQLRGDVEGKTWMDDVEDAERQFHSTSIQNGTSKQSEEVDEDDDADYWAQYDNEASTTPAPAAQPSPAPPPFGMGNTNGGTEEDNYYARYGSVQPAMDGHDPDEQVPEIESKLGTHHIDTYNAPPIQPHLYKPPAQPVQPTQPSSNFPIAQPKPRSGSQSSTASRLEEQVEQTETLHKEETSSTAVSSRSSSQPAVERETQNEKVIRDHISATMKSMYRLARATGVDRESFMELVEREAALCGVEEDDL